MIEEHKHLKHKKCGYKITNITNFLIISLNTLIVFQFLKLFLTFLKQEMVIKSQISFFTTCSRRITIIQSTPIILDIRNFTHTQFFLRSLIHRLQRCHDVRDRKEGLQNSQVIQPFTFLQH